MCRIVKYKTRFAFDSIFKVNHNIIADNELSRADNESLAGSVLFLLSFPIKNLHYVKGRSDVSSYLHHFFYIALMLNLHLSFIVLRNFSDHSQNDLCSFDVSSRKYNVRIVFLEIESFSTILKR